MASRYEQFVSNQRKKAEEVKKKALNGTLDTNQKEQKSITSRSDAFRANSVKMAEKAKGTPMSDLFKSTGGMINMNPLDSTLSRAIGGNPTAIQTYKQATGVDLSKIKEEPKKTNKIMNAINDINAFTDRVKSAATFGGTEAIDRLFTNIGPEGARQQAKADLERAQNAKGGVAADVIGSLLPGEVAWKAGSSLIRPLIKEAPKAIQTLARGATGGALYQAGVEGGEALNGQHQSLSGRARDIGVSAALGGVGDLAVSGIGAGVKKMVKRNPVTETSVTTESVVPEQQATTPIQTQPVKDTTLPVSTVPRSTVQTDNIIRTPRERAIEAKVEGGGQLTQNEIEYLNQLGNERAGAGRNAVEEPVTPTPVEPSGEQILRTGQFDQQSGLGISAFGKTKPYDSLSTDTRSQLVTRQQRDVSSLNAAKDKIYINTVDDVYPLQKQDELLEKTIDRKLPESEKTHTLALNSRGSDVISKRIVADGLVDSNGQVVGDSLKSVLKPLSSLMKKNKQIYVDFEDYLLNKHAITRAERGEKVFRDELNWTTQYGAQKVSEYEQMFPEFKDAADKLYNFNKQMVQHWLVDTGIISQDMAGAWIKANPYYVPNKRQFSSMEKTGQSLGGKKKGFGNQSNPVKGYQKGGSQRKIISPIESTIENVDAYVKAAKRNQVMQQYVKNIQQAPDVFKDWAEIVKQPERPDDIKNLLLTDEMGIDGIDQLLSRFNDDFDQAMQITKLDKDNIVRVMVNGEPVHVKINDKQLLDAITAIGPEHSGFLLNMVGKLTNNMKLLTTGSNPVFSLTRNLLRDIPQAYIASKTTSNPISFMADMASAALDIGMNRKAYRQFLDIGGGHASSIAADRNLLAQSKRAVLPQSVPRKVLGGAKDKYENLLNSVEVAPRLAEFKRTLSKGDDVHAALAAAQDLTVNFKRKGALSKEIDKVFPYFNAAVQGLDKTIRTYKDNPVKALVKSALALTVPTIALYAVNHNDPNYQKVSNRVKDAFLLIPKGDGTFIKIAKPQEQGTIFTDIPERLLRMFKDQDPAAFRDFADRVRTTFLPPGVQGAMKSGNIIDRALGAAGDTIFGPIADIAANKTFSGSPIVPGYLQNLSPELQYDAKTTSIAKKIGELTGSSPKMLDYGARQYLGVIGQFGQPLLSPGGDVKSALTSQVTADPVYSNDLSTEFYHYKDKLDQANNDSDVRKLPSWYNDGLRKQLSKIAKNMSKTRSGMRDIENNSDLTAKEKSEALRKLQQKINDMAEQGNKMARDKVPY